jgi:hypothetical protein
MQLLQEDLEALRATDRHIEEDPNVPIIIGSNFLAYVMIRPQSRQPVLDKIPDSPMGDNHVRASTHRRILKSVGH